ncbi:MAG: thiamine pyrophosphate-binding protein [Desulfofustis sp.]
MTGKEKLLFALKTKGIKYIFGYTGGTIMPVFDEMEKTKDFRFIMSRHEQGATFMAQGLSRGSLSNGIPQLGVCMATSGPGAMNLITGVADAQMDSIPMLIVTGQVATGVIATDAFQESDVVGVMMPICKQTYMTLHADYWLISRKTCRTNRYLPDTVLTSRGTGPYCPAISTIPPRTGSRWIGP